MHRRWAIFGVAVAAFSLSGVTAAQATEAGNQAGLLVNGTGCAGGQYTGLTVTNNLQNGVLYSYACIFSAGKLSTIVTQYDKLTGSAIRAKMGYQWVSDTGGSTGLTYYGQYFNLSGSSDRYQKFTYVSPGQGKPSTATPCIRGLLYVSTTNVTYSTRVLCFRT